MFFQVNQQDGDGRRGDAGDAGSLTNGLRLGIVQLGFHLVGEAVHLAIVQIQRQQGVLVAQLLFHFIVLTLDVTGVLDLDLNLFGRGRIGHGRTDTFDGHQRIIGHLGTTQQLFQTLFAGQRGVDQGVDRFQ